MIEVRRDDDGELCGYVEQRAGRWCALTVFGAVLAVHDDEEAARREVLAVGLAMLAERWLLRRAGQADAEVVRILEADPGGVTLALGYESMPGVPTRRITCSELEAGDWELWR